MRISSPGHLPFVYSCLIHRMQKYMPLSVIKLEIHVKFYKIRNTQIWWIPRFQRIPVIQWIYFDLVLLQFIFLFKAMLLVSVESLNILLWCCSDCLKIKHVLFFDKLCFSYSKLLERTVEKNLTEYKIQQI